MVLPKVNGGKADYSLWRQHCTFGLARNTQCSFTSYFEYYVFEIMAAVSTGMLIFSPISASSSVGYSQIHKSVQNTVCQCWQSCKALNSKHCFWLLAILVYMEECPTELACTWQYFRPDCVLVDCKSPKIAFLSYKKLSICTCINSLCPIMLMRSSWRRRWQTAGVAVQPCIDYISSRHLSCNVELSHFVRMKWEHSVHLC